MFTIEETKETASLVYTFGRKNNKTLMELSDKYVENSFLRVSGKMAPRISCVSMNFPKKEKICEVVDVFLDIFAENEVQPFWAYAITEHKGYVFLRFSMSPECDLYRKIAASSIKKYGGVITSSDVWVPFMLLGEGVKDGVFELGEDSKTIPLFDIVPNRLSLGYIVEKGVYKTVSSLPHDKRLKK